MFANTCQQGAIPILKVYEYIPLFFHFTNGKNVCYFLFTSLGGEILYKGSPLKTKNLLLGSKFFLLRIDTYNEERQTRKCRSYFP